MIDSSSASDRHRCRHGPGHGRHSHGRLCWRPDDLPPGEREAVGKAEPAQGQSKARVARCGTGACGAHHRHPHTTRPCSSSSRPQADFVAQALPQGAKFRALGDAGFFLDHLNVKHEEKIRPQFQNMFQIMNSSFGVNDACIAGARRERAKAAMASCPCALAPLCWALPDAATA